MNTPKVFVVRRYSNIGDSWSEHPGKSFDETVEWVQNKMLTDKFGEHDVVEVMVTKAVRISPSVSIVSTLDDE